MPTYRSVVLGDRFKEALGSKAPELS